MSLLLSTENKVLVYKVAIKPIRTYGIEIWGLRQQLKYCHPTKMPIQDNPNNGERATVRATFHASQRSRHPIHQSCPARKKHQTSRPHRGTSQHTSAAATPGKAKQHKAKTKEFCVLHVQSNATIFYLLIQ